MPKKSTPLVIKSIPAAIARIQFGQIMDRVPQNRERFLVPKKGEAKAVILGIEDFLQAILNTPQSLSTLQKQAHKSGAEKLTLEEIEAEIAAIRQATPRSNA